MLIPKILKYLKQRQSRLLQWIQNQGKPQRWHELILIWQKEIGNQLPLIRMPIGLSTKNLKLIGHQLKMSWSWICGMKLIFPVSPICRCRQDIPADTFQSTAWKSVWMEKPGKEFRKANFQIFKTAQSNKWYDLIKPQPDLSDSKL